MKLGRHNDIGVGSPSLTYSLTSDRDVMSTTLARCMVKHYNYLVMCRS